MTEMSCSLKKMAALVNLLQAILMGRHINIPLPYTDKTRIGNRRWLARPDLTQSEANLPTTGNQTRV
jgi:hypothetical protein